MNISKVNISKLLNYFFIILDKWVNIVPGILFFSGHYYTKVFVGASYIIMGAVFSKG